MIANERQYSITKSRLRRFERDLAAHSEDGEAGSVDPRIQQAMSDALASEADELRSQLDRYEQLRDGHVTQRELSSLREFPTALIEARIVARLTQRGLGELLGVVEQQVQRWEATEYAGVGLDRLQDVADALGIQIRETVTYRGAG